MTRDLARLVDQADLDELVRATDRLCEQHAWAELLRLRGLCRAALERGRQLWPIASLIEYRMALLAPAEEAASVIAEGAGHFALGPLTEVIASTHTWAELSPHLEPTPLAGLVAHERVVRGEDLRSDTSVVPVHECPLALLAWEPAYLVSTYRWNDADHPAPVPIALSPVTLTAPDAVVDDPGTIDALRSLVRPWVGQSDGRCDAVAVSGRASHAVAALGVRRARMTEIDVTEAVRRMAWAAASGGAHGRRRGAATGRALAWWVLGELAGSDMVATSERIERVVHDFRWFVWDAYEPSMGWHLALAIEDPDDDVAWAISAIDVA